MTSFADNRYNRPTSSSSSQDSSTAPANMQRSASAEQAKISKRKGTRSVSTLTPSQLARKRANDREAQRAIRARTKEHIERLESELEDLKSKQSRDQTIQELLRRNRALEDELNRLRESVGISINTSAYAPGVYEDSIASSTGAIPSPRASPFPSGTYTPASAPGLSEYAPGYVPFPNRVETWTGQVHTSVPSNVSSPSSSSVANPDEINASYIPTSAPTSMIPSPSGSVLTGHDDIKLEYDEVSRTWVPSRQQHHPYQHQYQRLRPPKQRQLASHGRLAHHLRPPAAQPTSSPARPMDHVPHVLPSTPSVSSPLSGRQLGVTLWQVPVFATPPANPVDELILNFIHECRRLPQHESVQAMLAPAAIDVRAMFGDGPHEPPPMNATTMTTTKQHPIEHLVRAILDLGGLTKVAERLAAFAHIQNYVAWLAHPTPLTQSRVLPEYIPRARQLVRPHPTWIGLVRWGRLRDAIIDRQDLYASLEFQHTYTAHLRLVNWPPPAMTSAGTVADQLITDPQTGKARLSEAFMAHAMSADNWRMGRGFVLRYPELGSLVELADDE